MYEKAKVILILLIIVAGLNLFAGLTLSAVCCTAVNYVVQPVDVAIPH
jgi:hypothetical protein